MSEFKIEWENDPENPDWLKNPVTAREMEATWPMFEMEHFSRFVPKDLLSELEKIGIVLSRWDNIALQTALKTFHQGPSVHYSPEAVAKEERILTLVKQLKDELEPEVTSEYAAREFWGEDVDPDDPEPSEYLYLKDFLDSLDLLHRSAFEHLVWLESAKLMDIEPRSNRADRVRYFYWLILLGFWKYHLKREIRTSSNGENKGTGPLVKFIQIMSKAGGLEFSELNGTAVRQWIKRNADRAEIVQHLFSLKR